MQFWKWASIKVNEKEPARQWSLSELDVRHVKDNLDALVNCRWSDPEVDGPRPDHVYVDWNSLYTIAESSLCEKPDFLLLQEALDDRDPKGVSHGPAHRTMVELGFELLVS